jgi:2-hydroxy-6-oxonona-2,4-dienedioate hydrolase
METTSVWMELLDTPFRLAYVDAAGTRTRYLEAGSGEPLILLHGTGGHLEAYARNFAPLSERFRVIAYDMTGHGYTDKPDRPYTVDVHSEHLLALMDSLGIERAHLSGESLGAWVAAWTAAQHPERVSKLVLNTPGNIKDKIGVMEGIKASSLRAVREASLETVRRRVEWLFYDKSLVTEELVRIRLAIYSQPGFLRAMENIVVLQDPEVRSRYSWKQEWVGRIEAETLLLWTSHDPTGGLDEGELLNGWLPNSRMQVIQNAGHWPQWEKPEEFHRAHLEFLGAGMHAKEAL